MEILNTNLLDQDDKKIQLGETVYNIPSDIPTRLYMQLLKASRNNEVETLEEVPNVLLKIFKLRQDVNDEEFLDSLTINKQTAIINNIFADMSIEETLERLNDAKESIKDGKKKPDQAVS